MAFNFTLETFWFFYHFRACAITECLLAAEKFIYEGMGISVVNKSIE